MALLTIYEKYPITRKIESYLPEIMGLFAVIPIILITKSIQSMDVDIDYTDYIITVVSIMLGFYFSNIFIISSAPVNSTIGKLPPREIKRLFKYNTNAIRYSILLVISYLLLKVFNFTFIVFYILTICNLFSGIRIYFFMLLIAKIDIKERIKEENTYY